MSRMIMSFIVTKHCTLEANAFIARFLAHVLPKGFVKIRYYGLLRVGNRRLLQQARAALAPPAVVGTTLVVAPAPAEAPAVPAVLRCPNCGQPMQLVQIIARQSRAPPARRLGGN